MSHPGHLGGAARETERQRWQRNFAELLQELRVAQTGVQILFAFLLIVAFTPQFTPGDTFARATYLTALLSAAAAAALIIAPVAHHRLLYRRHQKPLLVRVSSRMAYAGIVLVIVAMVSAVLLAADAVVSRPAAVVIAAGVGLLFLLLWVVLPVWHLASVRAADRESGNEAGGG